MEVIILNPILTQLYYASGNTPQSLEQGMEN